MITLNEGVPSDPKFLPPKGLVSGFLSCGNPRPKNTKPLNTNIHAGHCQR